MTEETNHTPQLPTWSMYALLFLHRPGGTLQEYRTLADNLGEAGIDIHMQQQNRPEGHVYTDINSAIDRLTMGGFGWYRTDGLHLNTHGTELLRESLMDAYVHNPPWMTRAADAIGFDIVDFVVKEDEARIEKDFQTLQGLL